jgi:hypothetical protein
MKNLEKSATLENGNLVINGEIAPRNNSLNNFTMNKTIFKLNVYFNEVQESQKMSNQPSLERLAELASKGYYFVLQPKTKRTGEAYFWVTATKQGEDREEFSLYVNEKILSVIVAILFGKSINVSEINADDLEEFNNQLSNFEYELFVSEKSQGRTMKKTYTTNGQVFSSYYKRGVIMYKPYLNPELKAYINA